ncbi:alkyl sulfatase dimerization domain-containing protein [Pseudofrankia inefficax]|uniref:Metallo-beta-lactamase domain-containing protein n=1 Tax=Pseudofrankia inefficax (strain DSM 45817 / CECT 9037 / DDB 130130 / EuI1c) TaxID=298654 RepID=E3J7U4_PSEI1|nr:alkyl sulfatase dimerization domain-containing protein [Pseudofrankia inefficax]ADP80848.1 hypothetical protein FraEuI1c_2821 [Pseudofrankia inefficax]
MTELQDLVNAGESAQSATDLGNGIFGSIGVANAYRVVTPDGDVQINTGLATEAPEIKRRFAEISDNPLRVITFTQGHPDHVGGWSQFTGPGVETIAQANHPDVREYWRTLRPFYSARIARLWGRFRTGTAEDRDAREAELTTAFVDEHSFTLGGRRFELYATPGGETLDALVVWLPADRTVFIGNLLGPMFGHLPNLYTIRGDKIRSAMSCLRGIERVLSLEPEVLINGHHKFEGAENIRGVLQKVHDAVAHLRERTIEGMNAGQSMWTLMDTVTLPPALTLPQLHGKVPWVVRAIHEEHVGWFRYESTTELYSVPPSAVWGDVVESAGSDALADRARAHADAGRPLEALHLTDMVLSHEPAHRAALTARRDALAALLVASGRENFSEVSWLEDEIADAERRLG